MDGGRDEKILHLGDAFDGAAPIRLQIDQREKIPCPIPAPNPDAKLGTYYRVSLEGGAQEVGFSVLDPREFTTHVFDERRAARVDKNFEAHRIEWDDGDGFLAAYAMSVKALPPEFSA